MADAIELLRQHEISQVPVVLGATTKRGLRAVTTESVVGSIQERTLLDRLYRNPDVLSARVSEIMDAPFNVVDDNEEIEKVFPLLATGAPAVLVERAGVVTGVFSRSDLLEFAAHQRTHATQRQPRGSKPN